MRMRHLSFAVSAAILGLFLLGATTEKGCSTRQTTMITKEQLRLMLNDPDVAIIDLRRNRDWNAADQKIAGAVHEDPDRLMEWAKKYPRDRKIVLYCA